MRDTARPPRIGLWIGAAALLLAAILAMCLRIQTVTVTGSERLSASQMESYLFQSWWDRNPLYCYIKDRTQPHRQIPFVEDYRLVFHGPTKVEAIVYDKSIVGYVSYMSSCMYFDKDGIVVESSSTRLEGVPLITGLKFGHLTLHQPLPVEDGRIFQDIMNLTQQLSVEGIQVDRIDYNSQREATLYIGTLEVKLGKGENIDAKISVLGDILQSQPQLAQMEGTLELEDYSEAGIGGGITFKRK